MKRPRSRYMRSKSGNPRRGAAMVEFGLAFGLFMVFFIATVEGGRLMWSWSSLSHATREGARYAMVHGEANPIADAAIGTKVKDSAIGLADADINVTTSWSDATKVRGSQVSVDSTYLFSFIVGSVTASPTITLRSRSTVTVAN